ncbi:hypothetical protein, partial [Burkholderia cepacia]|uniref:hypothetical protein n=1 Tax=Burkholderia cepacia TaxID=292 RepID=UPI001E44B378
AGNGFCLPNRREAKTKTPRMKIRGVFFCAAESCETTTVGVTMTASNADGADRGRYASRRDRSNDQTDKPAPHRSRLP